MQSMLNMECSIRNLIRLIGVGVYLAAAKTGSQGSQKREAKNENSKAYQEEERQVYEACQVNLDDSILSSQRSAGWLL